LAIASAIRTKVKTLYLLYFILPIAFVPVPSRLLSIRFTADTLPVRRANNFEKREKQLAVGWLVGWLVMNSLFINLSIRFFMGIILAVYLTVLQQVLCLNLCQ
jgi:hypothetical protein